VGTFKIVNGVKQGGNVATYFCTADGRVVQAVAGPVDATTLLREAKWALEIHDKAKKAGKEGDADYVKFVRQAHANWLEQASQPVDAGTLLSEAKRLFETHNNRRKELDAEYVQFVLQAYADFLEQDSKKPQEPAQGRRSVPARRAEAGKTSTQPDVHRLLAEHALDNIEQVYAKVWEGILKEKVSNDPVRIQGLRD
jgi:hypothetical protein